jgi:rSAM/selenodomain-associated transferase 1
VNLKGAFGSRHNRTKGPISAGLSSFRCIRETHLLHWNLYGIMIKYPEPGRVKTRLAKDIGVDAAAVVCRQLAERVMENTLPLSDEVSRVIFYDPPGRLRDFEAWFPDGHFVAQRGNDVGERMDNAIRDLLSQGAEKAVITGADIPDLNAEIIIQAFAALDHADIVIGPARDGGYYLIGMKSPHPEIFRNIPWSTGKVYQESVGIMNQMGLIYRTVTTLSDLDTIEDFDETSERQHS